MNRTTRTNWTDRGERAIPHMDMPRLTEIAPDIMSDIRPFALLLIARPVLLLALFAIAATQGWWLLAIPTAFAVYGSCVTATHHLIHGSLGLSRRARHFWLGALGCLMAESGHALLVTHSYHHRSNTNVPDPETSIEYASWRDLPLEALLFRYRLALWGLAHARTSGAIRFELAVHGVAHITSLALLPVSPILWVYLTLMHISSYAFALLASKGPQTNFGRPLTSPFVRVHTTVGRFALFSHDLHLEHHAYPSVPLPRLRRLLTDLDPVFESMDTMDVRLPA